MVGPNGFQRDSRIGDGSPELRLLIGLATVYFLYLIAGNLFLNTSLGLVAINRTPDKFQMQ